MRTTRAVLLFALMIGVTGLAGAAGEPRPAGVVVTFDDRSVTVVVLETNSLAAVLDEFCRQTGTRCEIGPEEQAKLAAEPVAPQIFQGAWTEVLSRLLAGTELNYALVLRSSAQAARLLVSARSPATEQPARGFPEQQESDLPRVRTAREDLLGSQGPLHRERDPRPQERSPRVQGPSGPAPISSSLDRRADLERGMSAAPPSGKPFVPVSPAAVTFMDQPVIPWVGPRMSPFPDENGNPVPLSGQPITVSPFPDENGHPVPVKPLAPGQPRRSPFPPPTTTKDKN